MNLSVRNRFILLATLAYTLLALTWIFLSDRLLAAFVDIDSMVWLSTVKGVFFVLVSAACFSVALHTVPPATDTQERPLDDRLVDALASRPWSGWMTYVFAVALVVIILAVRNQLSVSLGDRPLLVLFMLPIILISLLGGLGPGLVATLAAAILTLYFLIPPVNSFAITFHYDLFQWIMLVVNGLTVSLISEGLHRLRYRELTRWQQLDSANTALRQSEERFRRLFYDAPVAMGHVSHSGAIFAHNVLFERMFGYTLSDMPTIDHWWRLACPDPGYRAQVRESWNDAVQRATGTNRGLEAGEYRITCKNGTERIVQVFCIVMPDGLLATFFDITERKGIEVALRDREGKLSAIIGNTPSVLSLKTPDGRYILANPNLQRIHGMSEREIIGRTDFDLYDEKTAQIFQGNDRLVLNSRARHSIEETIPVNGEARIFMSQLFPVVGQDDSVLYTCRISFDITDRKRAEQTLADSLEHQKKARLAALNQMQDANEARNNSEAILAALRESEERLKLFIEHAPAALAMFDRQMCYLAASQRWLDDYALGDQDLLGQSHYTIFPEIGENWKEVHCRGLGGEVIRADEDRFERLDGSVQWLRWEVRPWHTAAGAVGGLLVFSEDITTQKQAELEIRRLNVDLERRVAERTAELTAANRELDSFAYAVSHDLRAPLRAMNGFSQALIEDYGGILQGDARLYLEQIIIGSRKMGELIDGLLTLSRSTRGQLQRDRVNLSTMAMQLLDEMAKEEPVRQVQWDIEPDLIVRGDMGMLEVVMANLLANAWKYTARRDNAMIRVFASKDGHGLSICIKDNGAGFEPSHAEKLFQPFQRLHRQEEFPGIGIGLATVQRIIHRHGGTLEARGVKDVGATFCFNLPPNDDQEEEVL